MFDFTPDYRRRAIAATAAIVLQGLLAYALLTGLSVRTVTALAPDLRVFDVAPPVPPVRPVPPPVRHRRPAGASAPPHARATPTAVVAPIPEIRLPPPPALVVAAPLPAIGTDASAGAADAGAGSGAGGRGSGLGSGTGGQGTGGGGTPARWLCCEIRDRDYPRAAREAGIEGSLTTRYVIDPHGHIADCSIVASSGSALLDTATCRLVVQRFRYAPARDANDRPVTSVVTDDHHWHISPDPPPDRPGW